MAPQELKPIIENHFDSYFSDVKLGSVTVSWSDGKAVARAPRVTRTYAPYMSYNAPLLRLGTANPDIPSTIPRATFTFTFRFVEEDRLQEDREASPLFWGRWDYAEGFGTTNFPIMRLVLSARDNHLYLRFDGNTAVGPNYEFGRWEVDLGGVEGFYKATRFVAWIDLERKAFTKVIVGGREVPFPPGYDAVAPVRGTGFLCNGMSVGDLFNGGMTNFTVEVDDVEVYAGYWSPPAEGPFAFPWWLLLVAATLGLGGYHIYRRYYEGEVTWRTT
jgi:hypothetical protein